jgi:peptidoglycan/LPS O-acetylase OafA/YrhL
MGVDLFFVLSGYLIADSCYSRAGRPSDGTRAELAEFWLRRWTRTLPLYYTVLFFYAVIKPVAFHAPFGAPAWRFPVFWQNLAPLGDFVQSWSLCIEEQFYLAFPILFYVLGARRPAIWLGIAAASPLARFLVLLSQGSPLHANPPISLVEYDQLFRFPTWAHLDGIAIGVFLASTKRTWAAWSPARKGAVAIAAVAIELAAAQLLEPAAGGWNAVGYFSIHALCFGGMLVYAQSWSETPRGMGWITRLAIWSYGAYLWNNVLERVISRAAPGAPWPLTMTGFLAGTFLVSGLTYVLIEKPGLRLRERMLRLIRLEAEAGA